MAITWGARPNTNQESYQSLGAIATGVTHTFTRYRTAADGASLHPLQRQGIVSADSHMQNTRHAVWMKGELGDGPPAAYVNLAMPPVLPFGPGSSRDPGVMI